MEVLRQTCFHTELPVLGKLLGIYQHFMISESRLHNFQLPGKVQVAEKY